MNRITSFFLLPMVWLLMGCSSVEYQVVEGPMLGTTFHLVAEVEKGLAPTLYEEVMAIDRAMKESMSIFDEESRLSRLNSNRTDTVDRHIAYNLSLAHEISVLSAGAYDVTVKPLVEAWGFAGRERTGRPNVDSLLAFVGYEKVWLEGDRLMKADPRVQLDFNSIAKGYTVDQVVALLEQRGAMNFLVEIGGEVRCKGKNRQGNPWRIGIEQPEEGLPHGAATQARIALEQGALATSGNYRRFFVDEQGRRVAHTIDPKRGESTLSRLLSATVVAENCARADAMATMFMALGADAALALAEQHPEWPLLFILSSEQGEGYDCYCSEAMQQLIVK